MTITFPPLGGDGAADQVPLSNAAVAGYMVGASYFNIQPFAIAAGGSEQPGSQSIFIPYRVYEDHDFDAISTQFGNGTLNTEFAIYDYDPTGLKLGAKLAGGTSGASPTLDILTQITFTAVTLTAGHYWLGFSGVGGNATTLYAGLTVAADNNDSGFLGFGINATPTIETNFYQSCPFYTTAARIAAISPGDALTSAIIDFTIPFLGLRAA